MHAAQVTAGAHIPYFGSAADVDRALAQRWPERFFADEVLPRDAETWIYGSLRSSASIHVCSK